MTTVWSPKKMDVIDRERLAQNEVTTVWSSTPIPQWHTGVRKPPGASPATDPNCRKSSELKILNVRVTDYSGSGFPLVSGANGRAAKPTRKTRLMVTPA